MKFKPLLVTALSGKLGGIVFSHNKGGTYARNLAIPVNPGTVFQEVVRQATAALSVLWQSTLTQAQRDGWAAYAEAVPIPDALGEPRNIPPLAQYVRSNVSRLQTVLPRADEGPTVLTLPDDYTAPTISAINAAADTADIGFDNTDAWANEDDAAMLVYISRAVSPTINFFKGPYRFAARIDGDAITAPTSPATVTLPFAVTAGQKLFFQFRVARADGRLSSTFRTAGTAA